MNGWRELGRRLRRLDPERRKLLGEAIVRLGRARWSLATRPFDRAIREGSVTVAARPEAAAGAAGCVWAVEAAARRVPWRSMCIEQGLALQTMLRRRGIDARLHYGARQPGRDGRPLEAHVWVSCDGKIVLGGAEADSFAHLASFPGEQP